jgi:hypothetical protein
MNPLEHYLDHGAAAGLNPDPRFITSFYRHENPDAIGNPLVHYVLAGKSEGRRTHPDYPLEFPAEWIDLAPLSA